MTNTTVYGAVVAFGLCLALACSQATDAQSGGPPVPFKVGTLERDGQPFVGLVLRDTQAVDIRAANSVYEGALRLTPPADMKALIARYDTEWKARLGAVARDVSTAGSAPAYSYAINTLKVLPPVAPLTILNAGGNYVEHMAGIAAQQQRAGAAAPPSGPKVS